MEQLILVTSDNKLYLDYVITEWLIRPDTMVFCTNYAGHQYLKSCGVTPQLILADERIINNYEVKSSWFAEVFMGANSVIGSTKLGSKSISAKEALSIDRLRFFANPTSGVREIISAIDCGSVIVEMDVFSSMPFVVLDLCRDVPCKVFIDDTAFWASWPEMEDIKSLYNSSNISYVLATDIYPQDRETLSEYYSILKSHVVSDSVRKDVVEYLSTSLSIPYDVVNAATIYGIVFDKRYEHRLFKTVNSLNDRKTALFLFYPIDKRSEDLIKRMTSNAVIADNFRMLHGVDKIIAIEKYEEIFDIRR